jgi:O-antigen/teichoic acid export membrane protein
MTLGVAGDHILGWIGHEQIGALIWWIPIGFALGGVQHALAFWNTRKKTFKSLAASNITRSLVTAVAQLLAGVAQAGALGLLLGTISGGICSNIVMVWRSIGEIWRLLRQHASLARMRAMMRTYRDFPKFTLPRAFLNNTTQNFPVLAFAYFFDPVTAGYYFLVNRLLLFPTKLVGESIRRVFYQDAIQTYHRGGKVFHRLLVLTLIMGGISLAPAVILALFGPPLFGLVFGDAWTTGGVYAQWLSMWWVAMFMQAPCVVMIPVLRLQQQALIYEVIRAVFRIGAIVVGAWYDDPLLAVALFGIVGVVFGMAMMVYILFATRRADANPSYVPGT